MATMIVMMMAMVVIMMAMVIVTLSFVESFCHWLVHSCIVKHVHAGSSRLQECGTTGPGRIAMRTIIVQAANEGKWVVSNDTVVNRVTRNVYSANDRIW
jgi:hypothetical protein